jgi:predicted N-acetyltransferase YhbS
LLREIISFMKWHHAWGFGMDRVLVRKLREKDAATISKIDAAITKVRHRLDFKRIVSDVAKKEGDASFVAESDGKVVAYMISYVTMGNFGTDRCAWIARFGVDPKFMGQGIGKKLAEKIFEFHKERGIKDIYTSVRWDSTDILSFCKTLGFERSEFIHLRKTLS